ncbi:DUF4811 domain-containing protein [Fructobacillus durionis]|uniref:DUF4811 domain-containing protein n=1 Tax=Fructobacillus durionis TaxID=283737 RepID=A0A1I1GFE5_9LACO|nr:DUF4811 domain-containing protein [Fructobacillus durionis]SFC10224.1 protein of unknown function [Fructobacillus durionis]
MMIWIIAGLTLLTFLSMFLIGNKVVAYTLGGIFAVLTVVAVGLLSANMNSHFGMEKTSVTTTTQVYSATPAQSPVKAVAVKKIGSDNYVLVYKNAESDAQASTHFVPNTSKIVEATKTTSTYEKTNVENAQVKTVTTKWTYKSDLWKNLFKHKNDDNTVSIKHTLQVPTTWQVMEK